MDQTIWRTTLTIRDTSEVLEVDLNFVWKIYVKKKCAGGVIRLAFLIA